MPAPLEFFFDFSSPYSYLLSEKIEAVATRHGRSVAYKPILLGAAFKVTGMAPLVEVPVKGDYSCRDFERSARFLGLLRGEAQAHIACRQNRGKRRKCRNRRPVRYGQANGARVQGVQQIRLQDDDIISFRHAIEVELIGHQNFL